MGLKKCVLPEKKLFSDSPDHVSRATPILKHSPFDIFGNF